MENANDKRLANIVGRIKTKREKMGVSQEKLALKAGVSEDTVYRLEQCKSIQLYNLMCILDALGLELKAIVLGYASPGGKMILFSGDQDNIEVKLTSKDKLIIFSNH